MCKLLRIFCVTHIFFLSFGQCVREGLELCKDLFCCPLEDLEIVLEGDARARLRPYQVGCVCVLVREDECECVCERVSECVCACVWLRKGICVSM